MIQPPSEIFGKGCLSQAMIHATFDSSFWPADKLPFSDPAAASASLGGIRNWLDSLLTI